MAAGFYLHETRRDISLNLLSIWFSQQNKNKKIYFSIFDMQMHISLHIWSFVSKVAQTSEHKIGAFFGS